uniref:Large ribosomal subunit protein uL15 n=1 Tax=Cyanistes caeruleus TaxID=156563 RepID=A0A8C0UK70_CYACU
MPSRPRDTQNLKWHISHSHTHRKHPRGRGNAGGMQHHRMNFHKHHFGYFRKVGMAHCHLKTNQKFCATVNLETVDTFK